MPQLPILERAFQLAASGDTVNELRAVLVAEGYHDAVSQTSFPSLRKQLAATIARRIVGARPPQPSKARPLGVLKLSCAREAG